MANAKQILKQLKSLANPEIAAHSQRFFKTGKGEYGEGDKFLGIRVPIIRSEVKKHRNISIDDTLELLISKYHEVRLFAVIILVEKFKAGDDDDKTRIYHHYLEYAPYINNWDLVDSSAPHIIGAYLYNKDTQLLYDMAHSDNLWQRRMAIIATLYMIKQNDFKDTLAIADILRHDSHDLIHKAVGWMLREIGNQNPAAEETFLRKHYKTLPRTLLRYAIEKFPKEKRDFYLGRKSA